MQKSLAGRPPATSARPWACFVVAGRYISDPQMRLAALATILVLGAGACSLAATPQTTVVLNLKDHQVEVPIDQTLVFDFGSPVDKGTASVRVSFSPALLGTFTLLPGGRSLTFEPLAWAEATTYTVRLGAFSDLKGNPVAAHRWTFTTTVVPRVESLHDDLGQPLGPGLQVEQGGHVTLVFSTPMSQPDTAVSANGQPAQLTWSADGLSATIPTAGYSVGPLLLALTSGQDLAKHQAPPGWQVPLDVAYIVHIATRHLPFPALVQIPNDGYGARPQVGVQAAAMIFEYQTEGSIQRLTALYTDAPDVVGPTRSGRRISFRLVRHYHGNLFLSGLSNDAHNVLNSDPVPAWFDNPPGFYRDLSRAAPNNLMLRGDAILADEQASGTPAYEPLKLGVPDLGQTTPATTFGVDEHRSTYSYDPVTGTYGKVEDGQTMTDASLGKPDQLFMVMVMHTHEFLVSDIESGCCTQGRDFDLDSGGGLDIYYRGQHATGSWSAADRASPIVFKNAAGQEISLPRGLVWVDVVGN
jgi:hypothetical protein